MEWDFHKGVVDLLPWTFLGENWEVWDMCLDVFGDVWMPIIQTDAHVALVLLTKHLLNVLTLV